MVKLKWPLTVILLLSPGNTARFVPSGVWQYSLQNSIQRCQNKSVMLMKACIMPFKHFLLHYPLPIDLWKLQEHRFLLTFYLSVSSGSLDVIKFSFFYAECVHFHYGTELFLDSSTSINSELVWTVLMATWKTAICSVTAGVPSFAGDCTWENVIIFLHWGALAAQDKIFHYINIILISSEKFQLCPFKLLCLVDTKSICLTLIVIICLEFANLVV